MSGDVTGIRTSLFEKSSSRVPIIGSKPLGIFFLALILYTKPSSVWQPQWARAEPFLSLTTLKPPTWELGVRASLKKSFTPLAREKGRVLAKTIFIALLLLQSLKGETNSLTPLKFWFYHIIHASISPVFPTSGPLVRSLSLLLSSHQFDI